MKLNLLNHVTPSFRGRREDKNTVNQLKQDNNYSLTENNQIRINKAIDNLANEKGGKNVKFLLDVADGLQYGTNIDLGKEAKNNWKEKLHNAASHSLSISDPITQQKYAPELTRVFSTPKGLSNDEKDILKSRESILSRLDMKQLENEKNPNVKNVQSNLDYFIASSETPIKQKKYILNRLDFFLSPDYKINPQLKNKKTQAAAEMINDIVVDTKESEIPNTKAINQKHHGMCAAISIARKLTSYEYKPQYVDSVMSELDDSDKVMVYDKTRLGQGIKVPVEKISVDFDDAERKGYRIVDASTTHWMHIADSYNGKNEATYIPFDAENFDVNRDNHFMNAIEDPEYSAKHRYYQSLLLSKDAVGRAKASKLKKDIKYSDNSRTKDKDIELLQKTNKLITSNLNEVVSGLSKEEAHKTLSEVLSLQSKTSKDIDNIKDGSAKYHFLPNEEDIMKERKIKAFIKDTYSDRVNKEKLDNKISDIRELAETSIDIQDKLQPASSQGKQVSKARELYEAAAAYRNASIMSMNDNDYRTDKMIKYNIPDEETLVLENLDKTINHVEKTGDKRYINHFSAIYGTEPTKDATVQLLNIAKQSVGQSVTLYLDEAYRSLGMGNRKEALKSEISGMKNAMLAGDNQLVKSSAFSLGMKDADKTKVVKEYNKFENILSGDATEKQYNEIFNKAGYKNQMQAFAEAFSVVNDAFEDKTDNPVSKQIIKNFNEANGIKGDSVTVDSHKALQTIGSQFNEISQNYSFIRSSLEIRDEKDNIINSAHGVDAVLSAMEKKGDIIPAKDLQTLKNRFDSIDKLRSQDEFSSKQGKLSDPTLYKLSKPEKETLKKINNSINNMYSETNKEINFVISDIRKPLEEHARQVGLAKGSFWNMQTGSGLYTEQEVKILEMMTDNKYRPTTNIEKAVDKIKNTEHSGITGSSVFHDRMGGHAQYVAEISPIDDKDVLYYDNSWGARENENTWVDSKNVRHTDYSDIRGGETGYITNDKYRNGNYVEDLMYKPGHISAKHVENKQLRKLTGEDSDYKFPMLYDTLVTGNDGKIKDLAISMRQNVFQPETTNLDRLKLLALDMTQDEIKASLVRFKTAGAGYDKALDNLDNRIETTKFHKGIETEADYNALKDDDPVKVTFEKVALKKSFPGAVDWKDLAKAETVQEVHKYKQNRHDKAREYFDYAFSKDPMVLYYYATTPKVNKTEEILNKALDNHNIKLDEDKKIDIIRGVASYSKDEKSQFDGSLKNTIGFMVNKTMKQFDKVVPDSEDARLAKQEIKENLTNSLSDALYINESDVNNQSTKFKAITKYIDKKYNPETNEDFVNVYRKLQDMTTEEFKKETSDVKDEDLAINDYSGYEMLKRYNAADSKVGTSVRNTVWQHELLKDITLSETTPAYKYNKLYKKNDGAFYNKGKAFDDLYIDLRGSLMRLDYEKMFNKYKDINLKKYNAMPAYPKMNLIGEKNMKAKQEVIDDMVLNLTSQIRDKKDTLYTYGLLGDLVTHISNLPDDKVVSKKQAQKISHLTEQFIDDSFEDVSMTKSVNSAIQVLQLLQTKGMTGAEYKIAGKGLVTEYNALMQLNPPETMQKSITQDTFVLKNSLKSLVQINVDSKHQSLLAEDLNNWVREEMKPHFTNYNISDKVEKLSNKVDMYATPKKNFKLTKSVYLDSLADDTIALMHTKVALDSADEENRPALQKGYDKQFAKINDATLKFVNGNINPEQQSTVYKMLTGFVDDSIKSTSNVYNEDKVFDAHEKFFDDFKKYNVLAYPQNLLDSYLLMNAKDSPVHSTDPFVASQAKSDIEGKETSLESALGISSLLEMQEYLMDAVASGNAEQVQEEFKNISVPLSDPKTDTQLNMDNDKAISYICQNLRSAEDDSTAVMFINKLGLADKYIKVQNEIVDFDKAKKDVRRTANILDTTRKQADIVDKEVAKFVDDKFNTDDDFATRIDNAKLNIINKTKNLNRQKAVKVYLTTLDNVKAVIAANPDVPRKAILGQAITQANVRVGEMANADLQKIQSGVKFLDSLYNLINKLDIPEYSPANQERDKFNAKYKDYEAYNNAILSKQAAKSSGAMSIKTLDN